jgi:hypothetical protein
MFPKTLIISINTHGIVPTDIENNISKPIFKKLKHPINLFKLNAVTYGVPFISSLNNTEKIINALKCIANKLDTNKISPQEISGIFKKQCIMLNSDNTKNIITDSNQSTYLNLYANYSAFMFNIVETKVNKDYVEKIFLRFDEEKITDLSLDYDIQYFDYFNNIKLLNVEGVSLFDLLKQIGHEQTSISLTDLIDFLYNMTEMKNLIIIDLTCSNTENDRRNNSRIRRELIKQKLY